MHKKLIALLCLPCLAFGITGITTLTGSLNLPNGTGANGTLVLALSQQGALSASGGCGGPAQLVPTYQYRITVTNGALIGSPGVYPNSCILPNGTFYVVQFFDTGGNLIFSDQWLVQGATMDIGTVVSVIISGTTQILGAPGVVLTAPTGAQTVTQPSSGNPLNLNFFTVSSIFTAPDGTVCNTSGCAFGLTASFPKGLATGYTNNSIFYTGPAGALYLRTTTGSDFSPCTAGAPPTGNDGFIGLRIDTNTIEFCSGGTLYHLAGM